MAVSKRVYRRGGVEKTVWRARLWTYPPVGDRKEISKEFSTRKAALVWEREQAQSARGRDVSRERSTIGDLDLWGRAEPVLRQRLASTTLETYRRLWRLYAKPFFDSVRLGDLSVGTVERLQAHLLDEGARVTTVQQVRNAVSAVFEVAVRDRLLPANPARGAVALRRDKPRVGRPLTVDELAALVDHIRQEYGVTWAVLTDLMGSVGPRFGEAAALFPEAVSLDDRVIIIERSVTEVTLAAGDPGPGSTRDGNLIWGPPKGRKSRLIPIPEHLEDDLAGLIEDTPRGLPILRTERDKIMRRNTYSKHVQWQQTVTELGIAPFRIHDLRATAASNLLSAGVAPHVVRDILGHSDLSVTNRYARSQNLALNDAISRISTFRTPR